MYNVTICIPTYKRLEMLKQLIDSISHCKINTSLINKINIIVVDNDIDKTAKSTINKLKKEIIEFSVLHYYNYPIKGLSNVRNELLKRAFQFEPDFIIFIDDDEFVTENWLNELVKTITINKADAACGPVLAKVPKSVSNNMAFLFERNNYEDQENINDWFTGNLILRRTTLEKYNIWFDTRFNKTGGEDAFFGRQMSKKGATIFWAANAITYENIPIARTKIKWFIKRSFREASTYIFVLKIEKNYLQLIKKTGVSMLYIVIGLFSIIFFLLPRKVIAYRGVRKLSLGLGGLAGLLNIQYKEYA